MPISAGDLRDRVAIERRGTAIDAHGNEVETWSALASRWTQIMWGRGEERRRAAFEGGSVPATFRMRKDALTRTITRLDRLSFDGALWDIASIVPFERDGIDITATRAA